MKIFAHNFSDNMFYPRQEMYALYDAKGIIPKTLADQVDPDWTYFLTKPVYTSTVTGFSTSTLVGAPVPSDINVHQGYAYDGENHYLFGTTQIFKYDSTWTYQWTCNAYYVGQRIDLGGGDAGDANHFCDGDYYDGYLYVGYEYWSNNVFRDQHIVKIDASDGTMGDVEGTDWTSNPQDYIGPDTEYGGSERGHEVSGVAIDGGNGVIYVTEYNKYNDSDRTSDRIYKYSLSSLGFMGVIVFADGFEATRLQSIVHKRLTGIDSLYIMEDGTATVPIDHPGGNIRKVNPNDGEVTWLWNEQSNTSNHEGMDFSQGFLRYVQDHGATEELREIVPVIQSEWVETVHLGMHSTYKDAEFAYIGMINDESEDGLIGHSGRPTRPLFNPFFQKIEDSLVIQREIL